MLFTVQCCRGCSLKVAHTVLQNGCRLQGHSLIDPQCKGQKCLPSPGLLSVTSSEQLLKPSFKLAPMVRDWSQGTYFRFPTKLVYILVFAVGFGFDKMGKADLTAKLILWWDSKAFGHKPDTSASLPASKRCVKRLNIAVHIPGVPNDSSLSDVNWYLMSTIYLYFFSSFAFIFSM